MKDCIEQEIKPGDYVAYCVLNTKRAGLRVGRVLVVTKAQLQLMTLDGKRRTKGTYGDDVIRINPTREIVEAIGA